MKILICVKNIHAMSGLTKHASEQAKYLSGRGHDVFVICERIDTPEIFASPVKLVKLHKMPWTGKEAYRLKVDKWITANRPELIIGHGDTLNQDILFMHNCVHLGHELIHGSPIPEYNLTGALHKQILEGGCYRLLVCNSNLMKDDFISRFRVDPDYTEVLYQDITTQCFDFAPGEAEKSRMDSRKQFGVADNELALGFITSGDFNKRNLSLMMEAFAVISERYPVRLFVAGKDKLGRWESLAEKLGITGRVTFLPMIKDVRLYYNMIDIFVLPSHIEEFGKSVIEAMYCRRPVVVSDKVGAAELIEGAGRDFILGSMSSTELVSKIEILISSAELRKELGEANRVTATEYSTENTMHRFGKMLKKYSPSI